MLTRSTVRIYTMEIVTSERVNSRSNSGPIVRVIDKVNINISLVSQLICLIAHAPFCA